MPDRGDAPRSPEFWTKLLSLIDAELSEPHEMVIVGGAAIGLRYTKKHVTGDIDSVTPSSDRKLWAAVQRACRAMQEAEGLAKPPKVSTSAVFDPPEDWESRQVTLRLGLKNLIVRVPEQHDLAISKVSRGLGRDYAALKAMHEAKPLRLRTPWSGTARRGASVSATLGGSRRTSSCSWRRCSAMRLRTSSSRI